MAKARNILGLAFEDNCIVAAEVRVRAHQPHLGRSGEFLIPEGLSLANPSELGQQLRKFLKSNNFASRAAVVGLPAKWLVARELTIPPANANAVSGILQIQAERAFALDPKDLVFDYWGRADSAKSSLILLMAAHRERINQVSVMTKAAGIQLLAITPTSHALRSLDRNNNRDVGMYVRDDYIEFWSAKAALPWISHAPRSARQDQQKQHEPLQAEIARLLRLLPGDGQDSKLQHVTLYAGSALTDESFDKLSDSLSGYATILDGNTNLLSAGFDAAGLNEGGATIAAAALALTVSEDGGMLVDFLHPRMAAAKRSPRTRVLVWVAVACVAIIAVSVAAVRDWRQDIQDIETYTRQLDDMAEDIEAARQVVDRMHYASGWTSRRPEFLQCLSQLTQVFPEEGTVWATTLRVGEGGQGSVIGKSLKEDNVLQVLDAIKNNEFFQNVQMLYMRDADRATDEVSFAITFKFSGGG